MSDFEKLINASDLIEWIMETYPDWCEGAVRGIVDHIDGLPSAQPEQLDTCPIYDGMCGYPSDRCYECPRHGGAKEKAMWWTLPSAQPDFDITVKIDKAYDDGYKCGYLQAKFDYEADTRGEQDE